jgi:hypothetical protein
MREAAQQLPVQLLPVEVHRAAAVAGACAVTTSRHADALVVSSHAFFVLHRHHLAELAIQHRLLAI